MFELKTNIQTLINSMQLKLKKKTIIENNAFIIFNHA